MNTIKKLLNENKKALQFIHNAKGFDFAKPFTVVRGGGRFTFGQIDKQIPTDCKAVMLLKSEDTWRDKLVYVDIDTGNKFIPVVENRRELSFWNYNIDEFYAVKQFEEVRKNTTDHYYVIIQSREYIRLVEKKKVDFTQRFCLKNTNKCSDGHGNTWINRLTLVTTEGKKQEINYETQYYCDRSKNVDDYIDKNGYLLYDVRSDLKQRAKKVRADKAKAAAVVADFSEREKKITEDIQTIKSRLAEAFINANISTEINSINSLIDTFSRIVYYFERHNREVTEKQYSSVQNIVSALDDIEKRIKDISIKLSL